MVFSLALAPWSWPRGSQGGTGDPRVSLRVHNDGGPGWSWISGIGILRGGVAVFH